MTGYIYTSKGHQVRDLGGKTFGLWRVLRYSHHNRSKAYWFCRCQCGKEKPVCAYDLTSNRSRACRKCSAQVFAAPKLTTHGQTRGGKHSKLHRTWQAIKQRCYNPKQVKSFAYHGALGVKVCDRWLASFEAFALDVGEPPTPQHSLDRWPNASGDYEPGNVRWATWQEQRDNRRQT
jgi:hypothetical protein